MVTNSKAGSLQMPGALAGRAWLLRVPLLNTGNKSSKSSLSHLLDKKKKKQNQNETLTKNTHDQCKQYLYFLSRFDPREAALKRLEATTLDHKSRKIMQEIRKENFWSAESWFQINTSRFISINNMETIQRPPKKIILGTESMWEINYSRTSVSSAMWLL